MQANDIKIERQRRNERLAILRHQLERLFRIIKTYARTGTSWDKSLRIFQLGYNLRMEIYHLAMIPIPRFPQGGMTGRDLGIVGEDYAELDPYTKELIMERTKARGVNASSLLIPAMQAVTNAMAADEARKKLFEQRPKVDSDMLGHLQTFNTADQPKWDYMIVDKDANVLERGEAIITGVVPELTYPKDLNSIRSICVTFDTKAWAKLAHRMNEKIVGHKCNHHRRKKRNRSPKNKYQWSRNQRAQR